MARRKRQADTVEYEKETLEQFLARGGRIETLPACVRTSDLEEQKKKKQRKQRTPKRKKRD